MIVKKKIRIFILCWQQSFHGEVNEYLGKKIGCEGTSERELMNVVTAMSTYTKK